MMRGADDDGVGIWGLQPAMSEEDMRKSAQIDEQLRRDRVEKMKEECSVLILAEASHQADLARHNIAVGIAKSIADVQGDVSIDEEEDAVVVNKEILIKGKLGSSNVVASSFSASKKNKASQMKLAAADPSVLVYVVSPDCTGTSDDELGDTIAKSLRKALAHLLFVGNAVGTLDQSAVCIVLSNGSKLRDSVKKLEDNSSFLSKLQEYFLAVQSSKPEDVLLGILTELETATKTFNVPHISTMILEESLHDLDLGDANPNLPVLSSVSKQMLSVIENIQSSRISRVEKANMESGFFNAKPVAQPKSKTESTSAQGGIFEALISNPLIGVGFTGVVVAVAAFFVYQWMKSA